MGAINLNRVFSEGFFRIPDYQRGYSWNDKQLSELWDDIDEIQEERGELKKHYTGTIFLEKTKANDAEKWISDDIFYVVDGQQRLTTLSILLFVLIESSDKGYADKRKEFWVEQFLYQENQSGNSKVYKFGYQESDKNYKFLYQNIFEDKNELSDSSVINLYAKNLLAAKKFFHDKIKNLSYEERDLIFRKVTGSLLFDIRKIEKDLDVQAVFETMNNRGKPLTILERLKNRLIYLNEKLTQPDEDRNKLRKDINTAWGKIYDALAQDSENYLDEDEFLSGHLSLYRRPKDSVFSEKSAEEKVFQMFCNKSEKYELDESETKETKVSHKKISDYIFKLSDLAPIWYEIHNSKDPVIHKILILNRSKEIKILLATLLYKVKDQVELSDILSDLEKLLFKNRIPGIWIMDERNTASWARKLYNENISFNTVLSEVRAEMQNYLNSEVVNQNIVNSFKSLYTYVKGAKGFHRWGYLKYFLFEYEHELKVKFKESNDKVLLSDYHETTIEHVIPQHYSDYWLEPVQEVSDRFETEDEKYFAKKIFLNSLGNLTILKNGKNASLGNSSWDIKKNRFSTGSYNEIDISRNINWTENETYARGMELLAFLEKKTPGLSLSDSEKHEILVYEKKEITVI
ncbi:Uncharacterized conserved protein, contains ParB-like and HNH nuclease domains [Chryseobacterium indologenes]|uniref:DUF262 domain-containing protein n=1 Tax=Chryseobacterium indologenes TaxID=253 RepID=UPI0003E0656B|nr:DUF262 domain-containing protein [Chryseobacterium indologenes]GAE64201.1 hypothetical protein CIN01S_07_01260 [Chryseobacterium indologenes NBRC 14944]SFI65175.1 Uncharacterized conserved protein, contains ParB-like and HNH nuclease domains [Chryseobacterium indologenes]SUX50464.1 Uncharacterized conserved protein [Chryseobacterium indologenes]